MASAHHELDLLTFRRIYSHFSTDLWALQRSSGVPDSSKAEYKDGIVHLEIQTQHLQLAFLQYPA